MQIIEQATFIVNIGKTSVFKYHPTILFACDAQIYAISATSSQVIDSFTLPLISSDPRTAGQWPYSTFTAYGNHAVEDQYKFYTLAHFEAYNSIESIINDIEAVGGGISPTEMTPDMLLEKINFKADLNTGGGAIILDCSIENFFVQVKQKSFKISPIC